MPEKITPAPLSRPLSEIAREIRADYASKGRPVHYSAEPYVQALTMLTDLTDTYMHDTADELVIRLLGNLATWRGPVATRVKAELRAALADRQAKKGRV